MGMGRGNWEEEKGVGGKIDGTKCVCVCVRVCVWGGGGLG